MGSSPRVWGQGNEFRREPLTVGIIPTRVGTRSDISTIATFARDHPHACGDKLKNNIFRLAQLGSSPRVWGQGHSRTNIPFNMRIIPTRVGTRDWRQRTALYQRDHPHACGDKLPKNNKLYTYPGSSPRVWGQETSVNVCPSNTGIIPTRVGTSRHSDNCCY